ncbi:hypothetical protein TWF730_005028 [Orbilia blumenaviensis]|uniref:Clr5 domain-containing protein n=1 Tax=Orbilia blumenaviensis TaxID=1796055 RepID=A0AAV9VHI0_9PEZI
MSNGAAVFNSRYSRAVLSKSDWEDHREFIQKHYIENDKTLEDLKVLLKENLGVEVTKHQLEYRCRRWKFRKNCSQTYSRQSQSQSVLKFPPTEAKKGRVKHKSSHDPLAGPPGQKMRTFQDEGINSATYSSFQRSDGPRLCAPDATGAGLTFHQQTLEYNNNIPSPAEQAEAYPTTYTPTGYDDFALARDQDELLEWRGQNDVDVYKPTASNGSQPLSSSSVGFNPMHMGFYASPSSFASGRSPGATRESLHQREYKNTVCAQRSPQAYSASSTNEGIRNEISSYADPSLDQWCPQNSGGPYPIYNTPYSDRYYQESGVSTAQLPYTPHYYFADSLFANHAEPRGTTY